MNVLNGIVRIESSSHIGTGFVVSGDGLIATCAHVLGASRPEKVLVVFQESGEQREAKVLAEGWRGVDAEDLAWLRVSGTLPKGAQPLPLGSSLGTDRHAFVTFGYPRAGEVEGTRGAGIILGRGPKTRAGQPLLQLRSSEITEGFSGAPVWDEMRQRVIGMVVIVAERDKLGKRGEAAFATPTETLHATYPTLQVSDLCPYRGLEIFKEEHAAFFCGREHIIKQFLDSLWNEPRFLAVFGASGSGKSSAVQAGLIPRLRKGALPGSDGWEIIVKRPTDAFFSQHLAQLERASTSVVLVIDQFEEIFTSYDETASSKVMTQLTQLLEHAPRVTLLIVMRDDFYSRLMRQKSLAMWLKSCIVHVQPTLNREEVESIIWEPAELMGLRFDKGLIEMIVNDVLATSTKGQSSTILPLLEFTLMQLWNGRKDGILTHEAYYGINGVTGALRLWADESYFTFEKRLRPLVRRVFTDLVHLGNEEHHIPDSRRRRLLTELIRIDAERTDIDHIIQRLVAARLLVTSQDQESKQERVELIHDALLWKWGRLKQWVEDDRKFLLWHQELEIWAQAWAKKKRGKEKLLRGSDLEDAETHLDRYGELNQLEQEFIRASKDRERFERRSRILLAVGGGVAVGLLIFLFIALVTTNYSAVRATQVRACMQQHHLKEAHVTTRTKQGYSKVTFARCDWLPPTYAGPDGYSEIQVITFGGPGESEASDTDLADRITAPCQKLQLSYTHGAMGIYVHQPPFIARADEIYRKDGNIWHGDSSTLNFYPDRGEIVVLHNGKENIDSATCV